MLFLCTICLHSFAKHGKYECCLTQGFVLVSAFSVQTVNFVLVSIVSQDLCSLMVTPQKSVLVVVLSHVCMCCILCKGVGVPSYAFCFVLMLPVICRVSDRILQAR